MFEEDTRILWDTENDCEANNWDGTAPIVTGDLVVIKELDCHCDPSGGVVCGGCVDIYEEHIIGERFIWKKATA